jgi:RimJ/RimL family protein N-acetyltransferase
MTASFTIATLDTPRLTLRAPRAADFDAYAQALSGGQARFMGGPFSRAQAWTDWCVAVA